MNEADRSVAIVVRATGERTAAACCSLLADQLPGAPLVMVGGRPFPETLADSLRAGVEAACEWTLCVDADVLPLPGGIAALLAATDESCKTVIELQPVVFDRFFGGWRPAGVHLYRTQHLPQALAELAHMPFSIRPETALLQCLSANGLEWRQSTVEFGLHDFEQWPHDVFRKCFVHAHKHAELGTALERYWMARATEPDFAEAIRGFAAGRSHAGAITLDASAPYLCGATVSVIGELASIPDVEGLLETEETVIPALFPERLPVWDWIQCDWAEAHSRRKTIAAFASRMLQAGSSPWVIERGDARTCILLQMASSFSIPVIGIVDDRLPGRRHFHGAPILARKPTWPMSVIYVGRSSDGRFVGYGPRGKIFEPEPGELEALLTQRPPAEQAHQLIDRLETQGIRCILVYGAGEIGAEIKKAAAGRVELIAYIESMAGQKRSPERLPVLSPEQAAALHANLDLVIASNSFAVEMVRRWFCAVREAGVSSGRIWMLPLV